MNIQNLEQYKSLSINQKREVLANLKRLEDMQYNESSFMNEYSEELSPNTNTRLDSIATKNNMSNSNLKDQVSIRDIILEYNPEFNTEFGSLEASKRNTKEETENVDSIIAYKGFENVAFDDFMT